MTFLEYIEDCNSFQHFLITDSELAVDDDLILKCSCIVISSDLYNHVIPLAHNGHLGIAKTIWLLRIKVYFPKLHELIEKFLAKCRVCKKVRKN